MNALAPAVPPPPPPDPPIRLAPRHKFSVLRTAIVILPAISAAMLWYATQNLVEEHGTSFTIKATLLALGAAIVAYVVIHVALQLGAYLAPRRYYSAGIASVGSILFVGVCLWSATYPGLVIQDVARLSLEEHGAALADWVDGHKRLASQATLVMPEVTNLVTDLNNLRNCEVAYGCISGTKFEGVTGPVARGIEEKAGRAGTIETAMQAGRSSAQDRMSRADTLLADYQRLVRSEAAPDALRPSLQHLYSQIRAAVHELTVAMPISALRAYASELTNVVEIPGRVEASRRLSGMLRQRGENLKSAIASVDSTPPSAPRFPARVGVSDTYSHVLRFVPVAGITAVVDLVVPLLVWWMTLLKIHWAMERVSPSEPRRPHEDDENVVELFRLPTKRA